MLPLRPTRPFAVLLSLLALACGAPARPQLPPPPVTAPSATASPSAPPEAPLPLDARLRKGTLANGLTYYVLAHEKPEHRAQLWLAVNAGSVLEDDDQRGLAHFVEHMGFNGTTRFPKQALVDFLEKSGVQFGADLNAYTSFDETVYTLQVPTDQPELVSRGGEHPARLVGRRDVRPGGGREGARSRPRGVAARSRRGQAPLRQGSARPLPRLEVRRPDHDRQARRSSRAPRATRSFASTRTGTGPISWRSSRSATSRRTRWRRRSSASSLRSSRRASPRPRPAVLVPAARGGARLDRDGSGGDEHLGLDHDEAPAPPERVQARLPADARGAPLQHHAQRAPRRDPAQAGRAVPLRRLAGAAASSGRADAFTQSAMVKEGGVQRGLQRAPRGGAPRRAARLHRLGARAREERRPADASAGR